MASSKDFLEFDDVRIVADKLRELVDAQHAVGIRIVRSEQLIDKNVKIDIWMRMRVRRRRSLGHRAEHSTHFIFADCSVSVNIEHTERKLDPSVTVHARVCVCAQRE